MGYVELDTDYIANALVKTRRETDRYCCYYVNYRETKDFAASGFGSLPLRRFWRTPC